MKFKEQRGNVFVFDGGYAGGELKLLKCQEKDEELGLVFKYRHILISFSGHINTESIGFARHSDIQTAVNLMQILIEEGLV